MRKRTAIQTITAIAWLSAAAVRAEIIVAYWDFGSDSAHYTENALINNTGGTPELLVGGTGIQPSGQAGTGFTDAEGTVHAAGQALAWNYLTEEDQSWIMHLDLTGYHDVAIRWDYRTTGTGPESATFAWRVGNGDWIDVQTLSFTRDSSWHAMGLDLSSISALNGEKEAAFRLSGFSGATGWSATFRTDNLQVTAIPEPATALMVVLGASTAFLARRREGVL